jgi:non-specific serine/threonine protein kinase/serine/threonine-protein kinase
MTPERWQRVEELYHAALARSESDPAAFLADACAGDEALRREVESLLAQPAAAEAFLAGPAALIAAQLVSDSRTTAAAPSLPAGTVIGPYHLLQLIGHGGMGEVWQAEQKQPVRRRVAVKLIKAGMDTREVVARFESERQALALMDHPAIAKVFEAGSSAEGRPYFVMEYVAGIPITDYCDKHRLTTRQRLELFIRVCDGVQHAHQKAIIHRDLKPSNILVVEIDGKPMPRIIDFGVAKATSQALNAGTMYTRVGAVIGTLGYMSPEQADSAGEDIDTRTDVYSLGVVLYELLVGELPFDVQKLAVDDVRRRLREQDAPRPSTKARTVGGQSATIAQNRGPDPPTLVRQLRGDPDAIALKALEKDRARRYATPSELAADIGRYLRHEPVLARSASAAYRTRKYVRRHRIGVAVAAAVAVLLVSVAVAQAFAVARITRERDRATRERDRADRITTFMTDMFSVSDPSAARGNSITAREILDKASKAIEPGLSTDPELQAQMMDVMGEVYDKLGLYPQARSLLTRAVDIRRQVLGPQHPETLASMNKLAFVLWHEGRLTEAEKLDRETLEIRRRNLGPDHLDTLTSMSNLALALLSEGHYAEAEKLYRETLGIDRRVLGPEHPAMLKSMANLANVLWHEGRFAEAEKLNREALEIDRRVLGPEHPDTLASMTLLASVLKDEGRHPEAEKLLRETLEIDRRILGLEHPDTLMSMNDLAIALKFDGRYAEAEKLYRETLEIERRALGSEHPITLGSMNNLADVLMSEGRYAEAEKLIRETQNISRRVLGPEAPETAVFTYTLGSIALREGKRDEAIAHLREAVDHGLQPGFDLGIEKDPDLKSLHGDPRFAALVVHAKERAAAAQKPK